MVRIVLYLALKDGLFPCAHSRGTSQRRAMRRNAYPTLGFPRSLVAYACGLPSTLLISGSGAPSAAGNFKRVVRRAWRGV